MALRDVSRLALVRCGILWAAIGSQACSESGPTGPLSALHPGIYALTSLGGQAAPFVTSKETFPNGTITTIEIAWDSILIRDDSTFTRTIERDTYDQQPGQPRERLGGSYVLTNGSILARGDEVLLAPIPTFVSPGELGYFVLRGEVLQSRIQATERACDGTACTVTRDRYVDGLYTRR
ncbi:MAG: hypothetical protein ABI647_19730 [Gemmatimonadota bacterium]